MNKLTLAALITLFSSSFAFALDLDKTQWRTIDDETGKAKALVEFQKQSNGTYSAVIKKVLDTNASKVCSKCDGVQKGKPVEGLTIVHNLKADSATQYSGGTILDPKSGKTYKMKGEVSADGKKLQVRGFIGISALGRNQIWHRAQ